MTLDAEAIRQRDEILEMIRQDDIRAGVAPKTPKPIEDTVTVAWAASRNPLTGGEYYRATRPAALSSRDFGWHTAVVMDIGTVEGSKKVGGVAYGGTHVIEPDLWVFRPMGQQGRNDNWGLEEIVERIHAGGQKVMCDLDDDVWGHEDWDPDNRPEGAEDDKFETWCWKVDGWLVSTQYLADRIHEIAARRGSPPQRVVVAPNCFDPIGLGHDSHPVFGRRIGTRLWLSGRMSGDLEIYRECFAPLLEELDLTWVHIGREHGIAEGPGQHARNFVDDCDMPAARVLELPSVTIPELGRIMGQTISIAAIAMADQPFNYAKTLTHAIEVASAGLPMVAATPLALYDEVPGRVYPNPKAVKERVQYLLDAEHWRHESQRARVWARKESVRSEATYMRALQSLVKELLG